MPPRKIMPQRRTILTRSTSQNFSIKLQDKQDTWYHRVEKEGRVEKRFGMTECKIAFRKGKLPPARIESMKNLFENLGMDDKKSRSPELECDYCTSPRGRFDEGSNAHRPDGICTCAQVEAGPVTRLMPRRTLSRIASWDASICPIEVQHEEKTTWAGPFPCRIENPATGLNWKPKTSGRIRVVLKHHTGLHYWVLAGTILGRVVHIFGYKREGIWSYATAKYGARRVSFQTDEKHPSGLEVDTSAPITDPRAFYIGGSASSGQHFYLRSAARDHFYVNIATGRRKSELELINDRSRASTWKLSR